MILILESLQSIFAFVLDEDVLEFDGVSISLFECEVWEVSILVTFKCNDASCKYDFFAITKFRNVRKSVFWSFI